MRWQYLAVAAFKDPRFNLVRVTQVESQPRNPNPPEESQLDVRGWRHGSGRINLFGIAISNLAHHSLACCRRDSSLLLYPPSGRYLYRGTADQNLNVEFNPCLVSRLPS